MVWTIYCHRHIASGRRYIGQTKVTIGKRWGQHVRDAKKLNSGWFFASAIRKYGPEAFTHEVLEVCSTLEAANEAEAAWIDVFSTRDPEFGFNLRAGGRESNQQTREDIRAKMSAAATLRWATAEGRAEVLASQRAPEVAAKRSANGRAQWKDPEIRARNATALRGSHTPEGRAVTEASRRTPEVKAKQSKAAQARWERPEYAEKARAAFAERQKKLWADPDYRVRMLAARRKAR